MTGGAVEGAGLTGAIFADSRPRALAALVRSFRDLDMAALKERLGALSA